MPKASPACGDRQNAPPEWLSNSPLAVTIQSPSCFVLLPLMGEVLRGGGSHPRQALPGARQFITRMELVGREDWGRSKPSRHALEPRSTSTPGAPTAWVVTPLLF